MYTLIEIFDAKQYENILASISLSNINKVIFFGSKEMMTEEKLEHLKAFLKAERRNLPCEFIKVERDNSAQILNSLERIIEENPYCVFDVTGGEDVILTLVGITAHKYNLPVIRMNAKTESLAKIYGQIDRLDFSLPSVSVRSTLLLQGANIRNVGNSIEEFTPEDIDDLIKIFEINSADCENYSTFCNIISEYFSSDHRYLNINIAEMQKKALKLRCNANTFLEKLIENSLLTIVSKTRHKISAKVKSDTVYYCLSKAGNALELYTALALSEIKELTDIKVGTSIDWDMKKNSVETQNEIDVIAMKGAVPIFVSCKNGEIRKESLYELDTVSRALGGAYAKKIFVATYISKSPSSREHFIKRAYDMGIGLVYNVHKKTYSEFLRYLKDAII